MSGQRYGQATVSAESEDETHQLRPAVLPERQSWTIATRSSLLVIKLWIIDIGSLVSGASGNDERCNADANISGSLTH